MGIFSSACRFHGATILTLPVIPTVYEILADTREWLAAKVGRGEDPGGATEPVRVGH